LGEAPAAADGEHTMTRVEYLLGEFAHEAATARKHIERLPASRFEWRPHKKSFTAGQLASHMVDCICWIEPVFGADELDFDEGTFKPFSASSPAALLETFDREVARGQNVMAHASDTSATELWRLKLRGKVWFEKPREAVFRNMTLSHLVHHRGQFSVYLRLLDVAVPGSYGPTADDR
jgi:uncharacterized damage-inducible protein DinB